ncbi:MAG: phosphoribosylformylglycinamidine synthase subunit PurS [Chloroflexota bacterium]
MFLAKVYVTLKATVNDPQGLTIKGGLQSLGFASVESVRAGKYMEIRVDAASKGEAEAAVTEMCRKLLANPVIEEFRVEVGKAS